MVSMLPFLCLVTAARGVRVSPACISAPKSGVEALLPDSANGRHEPLNRPQSMALQRFGGTKRTTADGPGFKGHRGGCLDAPDLRSGWEPQQGVAVGEFGMKLYSSGALPQEAKIRQVFDMIAHTGMVSLRRVGTGDSIDDRSQAVRKAFEEMVPEEANAVIGVQVTTDVVLYDIGSGGEYHMTWCGNPAVIEEA